MGGSESESERSNEREREDDREKKGESYMQLIAHYCCMLSLRIVFITLITILATMFGN